MKKSIITMNVLAITFFLLLTGIATADILSVVIHKKGDFIGATVSNMAGEKLGEISDLVFAEDTGDIRYVVLAHEGTAGNGKKLIPVPLDALRFISEKHAQINISRERLASAPGYEKNNLPDKTDRQWHIDTHSFYGIRHYGE